jgi:YHS domain-containing protein
MLRRSHQRQCGQRPCVRRRKITSEDSRFFSDYDGQTYHFCSTECKRKFDDHPDPFIQHRAREQLGL